MMRNRTINKWKPVIDGYDPEQGTVSEYCSSVGIDTRKFYYYRQLLYGKQEENTVELLPVEVIRSEYCAEETRIHINGVPVSYQSDKMSDKELSRILRLCRDL